jgi:hypothetical protein
MWRRLVGRGTLVLLGWCVVVDRVWIVKNSGELSVDGQLFAYQSCYCMRLRTEQCTRNSIHKPEVY